MGNVIIKKRRMTHEELLKSGLVDWHSPRTTYRKIEQGFPYQFDGRYTFDEKEIAGYYKQRRNNKKSA